MLCRETNHIADLVRERVRKVRALQITPSHHTHLRNHGDGRNRVLQQGYRPHLHVLGEGNDMPCMCENASHRVQFTQVLHVHVDVCATHHNDVWKTGLQREGARANGVDAEETEEGAVIVVIRDVVNDCCEVGSREVVRGVHHLHSVAESEQMAGNTVACDGVPCALLHRQHEDHSLGQREG